MKKWFLGFFVFVFLLFFYSRAWFLRDFVLSRKELSHPASAWLLVGLLSLGVATTFFLARKKLLNLLDNFFKWILIPSVPVWLFTIFLLASSLRIAGLVVSACLFGPQFFYETLPSAALYNSVMAEQLVTGEGYSWDGIPVCIRPPGYSFISAVCYSLFGIGNPWPVLGVNLLAGVGIALCAYFMGRKLLGEETGRVASLFSAFSWPEIYQGCFLLEETLFTFLFVLAIYLLISQEQKFWVALGVAAFPIVWTSFVLHYLCLTALLALGCWGILLFLGTRSDRWRQAIGVGIFLGLACYFRPTLILFPFLLPIVYFLQNFSLKQAAQRSLMVFVVLIITLTPWIARNTLINQTLTFLSTNGGGTLFEDNLEICKKDPDFSRYEQIDADLVELYHRIAERQMGETLQVNQGDADRELGRYTLRCMYHSPLESAKTLAKRVVQFCLNANQVQINMFFLRFNQQPLGWVSYWITQLINVVLYGILLFLFTLGVWRVYQTSPSKLTGLIPLFYIFLFLTIFTPQVRYRIPIWTFVYLYAAFGLTWLAANINEWN